MTTATANFRTKVKTLKTKKTHKSASEEQERQDLKSNASVCGSGDPCRRETERDRFAEDRFWCSSSFRFNTRGAGQFLQAALGPQAWEKEGTRSLSVGIRREASSEQWGGGGGPCGGGGWLGWDEGCCRALLSAAGRHSVAKLSHRLAGPPIQRRQTRKRTKRRWRPSLLDRAFPRQRG